MAALLLLAGCQVQPPSLTPPPPVATTTPVPTIVVTQVVTQEIVVTATPASVASCAPDTLANASELVIGALAPLSPPLIWPRGLGLQAGAVLAVEDINAAGGVAGKPVRLVTYDTAGQPLLAAQLAERLLRDDCAIGLIGGVQDEVAASIKQVSERYGVPFLILEAAADELTADQAPTVFRLGPTATMLAQMPALWLTEVGDYNGDGKRLAVIITENTQAGAETVEQVGKWLDAYGIEQETLSVDLPAQDFSPQIARIVDMEATPDAIFLSVGGEAALELQQQLLMAGLGPTQGVLLVTGRAALDGPTFWARVPDGAWTVVARRGPWTTTLGPLGQSFTERYRQLLGQAPELVAYSAYDAVHLLADAAVRAPTLAPAELIGALESSDIELAAGRYHFPVNRGHQPDGDQTPAYLWHQWPEPPMLYLQYRENQQDPATLDVIWPPAYQTTAGPVLP